MDRRCGCSAAPRLGRCVVTVMVALFVLRSLAKPSRWRIAAPVLLCFGVVGRPGARSRRGRGCAARRAPRASTHLSLRRILGVSAARKVQMGRISVFVGFVGRVSLDRGWALPLSVQCTEISAADWGGSSSSSPLFSARVRRPTAPQNCVYKDLGHLSAANTQHPNPSKCWPTRRTCGRCPLARLAAPRSLCALPTPTSRCVGSGVAYAAFYGVGRAPAARQQQWFGGVTSSLIAAAAAAAAEGAAKTDPPSSRVHRDPRPRGGRAVQEAR